MAKITTNKVGRFYQTGPRVACVVTARARNTDNAMTATWHCPISVAPPLYGFSFSPQRFTYELIMESRVFGMNFLPSDKVDAIAGIGGTKGQEVDKFQKFSLKKETTTQTAVPILQDAYLAYECKLFDHKTYGDHEWVVGEVIAVHIQEEVFTPKQILDLSKISPTLYLGNDFYVTLNPGSVRNLDRKVYTKH